MLTRPDETIAAALAPPRMARGGVRGKRWMALALLPVLLLCGDYFYWRLAAGQLRNSFEKWAVRARASGWEIKYGPMTTGGWPDAAILRVANLTAASASPTSTGNGTKATTIGGFPVARLGWGSDALLVRAGLTRPDTLEITPVGLHALRLNDGPPIPISAEHLHLRLHLALKGLPRSVEVEGLLVGASIPGMGLMSIGHLEARADLKPDAGRDQAVVTFSAEAQTVLLPAGERFGLGSEISDAAVEGALTGPWPTGGRDLTSGATAWRDGGGALDLQRLAIGWGDTRLDASATLALDEDLQPMGTGTGKIAGFGAALDAMAASQVVTRSAAQAAKAVLSLLASTPGDGQPEEVEVPLTLQYRTLSVRQVPLVRFPALDWPER